MIEVIYIDSKGRTRTVQANDLRMLHENALVFIGNKMQTIPATKLVRITAASTETPNPTTNQ